MLGVTGETVETLWVAYCVGDLDKLLLGILLVLSSNYSYIDRKLTDPLPFSVRKDSTDFSV